MGKSGKPESSCGGDDDRKPGPIYGSQILPSISNCSGDNYCQAMTNELGSGSFQTLDDNDPTRSAETTSAPNRNARRREIDRQYRERNKTKEQEMRSNLCRLEQEKQQLIYENESLRQKHISINHSLQSQGRDMQQLRNETVFWKFEHAKQTALVQILSDQFPACAATQAENLTLMEDNLMMRRTICGDDETLLKLAEDTANLKLEKRLLEIKNDALTTKMVHLKRDLNRTSNNQEN